MPPFADPSDAAGLLLATYWAAAFTALMLVAGPLLLRRGLRGRLAGDHPVCRKCEYDLFALPAEVRACPECGADLAAARATVLGGHRRPRPRLAATGLGLLGLAVLGGITTARFAPRAWAFDANRPTWWLIRQLDQPDPADRDRAFAELARRAAAGTLSAERTRAIADHVIRWQADRAETWDAAWGDFVESARAAGKVGDNQWATYARQAPAFELERRPSIRRGEPLPFLIWCNQPRVGSAGRALAAGFRVAAVRLGGLDLPAPDVQSGAAAALAPMRDVGVATTLELSPLLLARLADGPQTLEIDLAVDVFPAGMRPSPESRTPIAATRATLATTVTVWPAGAPVVVTVRSRALDAALAALVRPTVTRGPYVTRVDFTSAGLDENIAADVILRAGDREWPARPIELARGRTRCATVLPQLPADLTHVDVVLRGSDVAAARTLTMTRVWAGEHVFRDVPIKTDPPRR